MRVVMLIFIVFFSSCLILHAQFLIVGEVKDSSTKNPIEYCQLGLINSSTNQLIDIATTDNEGKYKFDISKHGIYRITVNSLTHKNIEQEVLFLGSKEETIKIDLFLSKKAIQLSEIVITAKLPPIIIKEDTIIYHIEKWTHASDENLEDVLQKIPGFEVLKDGEIKLNGKSIDKVLIDGKEILDAGTALTTRSLAPDMIKRIEVRLKEKADQYKESILSSNDLIVLDIKLKEELNLSLFGKANLKAGIQNTPLGGTYLNIFSLGKKNKTHILGEYDQFGVRTISISQLKNIDKDSYLSLFSLPADYKSLTEREEYNKEIYGFKDYSVSQPGSISITNKFSPSNRFEIYMVSFNSFIKESILDKKQQILFQSANNQFFSEEKTNNNLVSKNRVEIKYNMQGKFRAEYNIIYSINRNINDQANMTSNDLHYIFHSERNTSGIAQNWQLEYKLNKKLGLHASKFLCVENSIQQIGFQHNDPHYFSVLSNNQINSIMYVEQDIKKRSHYSATNLFIRYSIKHTNINLGVRVGKDQLKMEKESSSNTLNLFTGKADMLLHHQVMPYSEVNYTTNKLRWRGRMGVNYSYYPSIANQKNSKAVLMDYVSDFSFNINNFDHVNLLWRQNLSTFSLQRLVPGSELINFQTISFPGFTNLTPQTERLAQLSYSTSILQKWGIGIVAASVYGNNNNSDRYEFSRLPFIGVEYHQLGSSYVMNSLIITKVFDKFPMSIKVEAGHIKNWQKNLDPLNNTYNTQTRINLFKLILRPLFDNKSFDMSLSSQYQFFKLANGTELKPVQTYISTHFSASYSFIKKLMFVNAKFKSTNFTGIQKANYFDLFIKGQYKKDKMSLSIEVDNLLNNKFFFKREINPAYQIDIQRQTFSRYIAFSFEFRLR